MPILIRRSLQAFCDRVPTIDFQTATRAGLQGLSDLEVLTLAAKQGRVLVTHDRAGINNVS